MLLFGTARVYTLPEKFPSMGQVRSTASPDPAAEACPLRTISRVWTRFGTHPRHGPGFSVIERSVPLSERLWIRFRKSVLYPRHNSGISALPMTAGTANSNFYKTIYTCNTYPLPYILQVIGKCRPTRPKVLPAAMGDDQSDRFTSRRSGLPRLPG